MLFFIKITPVNFNFFDVSFTFYLKIWLYFHIACQFRTDVGRSPLGTPLKLAFANNEQPIIRPYRLCCSRSHLYSRWNREIDDDEPVSKQKTGNRYSIEKKPAASHDNSRSIKRTNHGKGKQKKYITERKVTRRGAGNAIPTSLKAMAFLTRRILNITA